MQNSYSDHRKLDSANQSYKFGKNYAVSAIKRTICNTSNAATRFHVILCSPFQNDNVVENIPGIANCFFVKNLFVLKPPLWCYIVFSHLTPVFCRAPTPGPLPPKPPVTQAKSQLTLFLKVRSRMDHAFVQSDVKFNRQTILMWFCNILFTPVAFINCKRGNVHHITTIGVIIEHLQMLRFGKELRASIIVGQNIEVLLLNVNVRR
jgi:hypothetical protein